jgi:hypothetical protein
MSTFFSLMAHGLLLMTVLLMLLQVRRWKQYWPLAYLLSAAIIVLPLSNWLLIEFSRGLLTDLSLASLLMLGTYLLSILKVKRPINDMSLNLVILLFAILLYPASMGLGMFDPYSLGFASHVYYDYFVLGIAAMGIFAAYIGYQQLAIWLTLSCIAHGLQVYESSNLWNYLLDPFAVIAVLVSMINTYAKKLYFRISSGNKKNV